LATSKGNPNLANSRGKIKGVKKVSIYNDKFIEKPKKQPIFYVRNGEIKYVFFTNKPMILHVYKKASLNTNKIDHGVPSVAIYLLQEFDDVLLEDISIGLPPLRGHKTLD
jgi:hypothetical protein